MRCVILTGLPGAGKSTVCKSWFPTYLRINQDQLGNRAACIAVAREAFEANKNVIIDRVNHSKQQRAIWLDLALGYGAESITSVFLDVPADECVARIDARKSHETITEDLSIERKRLIVYNFHKELEIPALSEGFSTIIIHRNV